LTDRKQQILQNCCELIAAEGYVAFTMRAVARASGLKLGALQYHYRTRDALVAALAEFIGTRYRDHFTRFCADRPPDSLGLYALLDFMAEETVTTSLRADRLFPQLWAMAMVEPAMRVAMDGLYEQYLTFIEDWLIQQGASNPRGDALAILSMLEGLTLFVDSGRRWEAHAEATLEAIHAMLHARYGASPGRVR